MMFALWTAITFLRMGARVVEGESAQIPGGGFSVMILIDSTTPGTTTCSTPL